MTADTSTVLRCNRPGCTTTFGPTPYGQATTRELARQYSWGHSGADTDLCPEHANGKASKYA